MATERTGRKIGRPKKPLPLSPPEPKKAVGRPKIPPIEDPGRHIIAFYAAHRRVIEMRPPRGNRKLGANSAATWVAMLRKSVCDGSMHLLKGQATPDGFITVVPMAPGKNRPLRAVMDESTDDKSDGIAGVVKTMKKKEAAFWKSDDATKRWFDEAVIIFMDALAAVDQGDASKWILAQAEAEIFGDSVIIDLLRRAPAPKLEEFNPFDFLGRREKVSTHRK
jgi:hypothetical protein